MLLINFDPFPLLNTERLTLRPINVGDAPEIYFLRSDIEVLKYLGRAKAQSIDDAVAWIEVINKAINESLGVAWAITLKDDPTLIGNVGFWNISREHHRAEIGYVLHPQHQKLGIMHEALKAVIHYGFHVLRLHSIEANIDPENIPSKHLLEKNGFIREAYYKENYFFEGKFIDSAIYSLLTPVK